jgi:serine/threonine-protein kinase
MMDSERWDRLEAICHAALQRAPEARAAFLTEACGTDAALRRDAEALLQELEAAPEFLETPLVELASITPASGPGSVTSHIGPFRVIRPLGHGGMGDVFLAARDVGGTPQYVAVKVIRRGMDSEEVLRRFHQERQILARLNHPNIAHLIDAGATDDGRPYFVMEYVEGEPIDAYCDRLALAVPKRLQLIEAVAGGLQHAHGHLVVHRDLKPGNILVTPDGVPKLLDFGIGKILDPGLDDAGRTRSEVRVLTPEYASPEQVQGRPVTTATDVHGLGVLLYRLLAGRHPWAAPGRSIEDVERAICDEEPPRPSRVADPAVRRKLAGDLDVIVLKALRKDPGRRYASPGAMAEDLRRHREGLPVAARPDTPGYRATKFVRRNAWPVTAAAVAMVALTGLAGISLLHSRQVTRERDAAVEVRNFLLESFGARGADRDAPVVARELLDQQAATLEFAYSDRPALQAEMLQVVAEGYERLGLYGEAERRAREALALRREAPSGNPSDLAWSLEVLGWIRVRQEDHAEAESLLTRSVDLFRRAGTGGRRGLARALNDLGVLRQEAGDLDGAETALAEALDIRTRYFPRETRGIGVTGNNLAGLYYRRGDYQQAAARGAVALAALRQAVGPDHQRSIIAQSNLATIRMLSGDFEAAETDLRDLVERQSRIQGPDHLVTTRVMVLLANVLNRRGKPAEAESLLIRAVAAQERSLGASHGQVGVTLRTLSQAALNAGAPDRAIAHASRAVDITRRAYGRFHTETAEAIDALGLAQEQAGDLAAAERSFREALLVLDSVAGRRHPRTAQQRYNLARNLTLGDRDAEALDVLRVAHEMNTPTGREPILQLIRLQMAFAHLDLGHRAAAESLLAVVEGSAGDSVDVRVRRGVDQLRETLAAPR